MVLKQYTGSTPFQKSLPCLLWVFLGYVFYFFTSCSRNMSKRYDELLTHRTQLEKREKLDKFLKKEGYMDYKHKVWRFKSEEKKWEYVERVMHTYEKDEKSIALFSQKPHIITV